MSVSIKSSANYKIVWFEHFLPYRFLQGLFFLWTIFAVISGFVLLWSTRMSVPFVFGRLAFLIVMIYIPLWMILLFSKFSLRNQGFIIGDYVNNEGVLDENVNHAEFLSFDSAWVLFSIANRETIDVGNLILRCIDSPYLQFVFNRLGIPTGTFRKLVKNMQGLGIIPAEVLVTHAIVSARENGREKATPSDILIALYKNNEQIANLFFDKGVQEEDLIGCLAWGEFIHEHLNNSGRFWSLENLLSGRGIGNRWAFGFTSHLDDFSKDLTSLLETTGTHVHVIGHKDEISLIEQTLARKGENNVLLVGDAGVGKSTVILGFAQKIISGKVSGNLIYKRVVELDVSKVLSGLTDAGQIQERIELILFEAVKAGNIILVVDNLPKFLSSSEAIGTADLTSIFTKYMSSDQFQIIATSDRNGFHRHIESDSGLMELLQVVEVKEPDKARTLLILEEVLPGLERQYQCTMMFQGLKEIVDMADRLIQEVPFPEKALQLLQDFMAHYIPKEANFRIFGAEEVAEFLSKRTGIPLKAAEEAAEKEKLLHLEDLMHERLIDQTEAVGTIAEAMRRNRAGLSKQNRPIGSFLFLGPTGVGKTETAKTLAQIYFGSEERMIRLDMTEYQSEKSVERLIGSQDEKGQSAFINKIREKPFSLVLLDEIEKAHPNVLNLFLQVLDEGHMTDILGRKVSFNFSIIIATSNAGAEFIRQELQKGTDAKVLQKQLIDHVLQKELFKPEFINRFDAVVMYHPLGIDEIRKIALLMLKDLETRIKNQGYEFEYTDEVVEYLATAGFDPIFGARAMRRTMNEKIEGFVARRILAGQYKRGATIRVEIKDLAQ